MAFNGLSNCAKMVGGGGGRPFLYEYLAKTDSPSLKTPISNQYSLMAPQP